jgi:hypothetical protein
LRTYGLCASRGPKGPPNKPVNSERVQNTSAPVSLHIPSQGIQQQPYPRTDLSSEYVAIKCDRPSTVSCRRSISIYSFAPLCSSSSSSRRRRFPGSAADSRLVAVPPRSCLRRSSEDPRGHAVETSSKWRSRLRTFSGGGWVKCIGRDSSRLLLPFISVPLGRLGCTDHFR